MYKKAILISSLFFISGCSTYAERNRSVKWLTPHRISCYENGGGLYYDSHSYKYSNKICGGLNFNESKKVCSELDRVLPTLDDLQQIAISCGIGNYVNDEWKNTKSKKLYYSCFEKQGFASAVSYLTSTMKDNHVVTFEFGDRGVRKHLKSGWGTVTKEMDTSSTSSLTICRKK
jgi:hypothetical protein